MASLTKTLTLIKTLNPQIKSISTFTLLNQQPQHTDYPFPPPPQPPSQPPATPSALPPSPSVGSPLYTQNWRNPIATPSTNLTTSIMALNHQPRNETRDVNALLNLFGEWVTGQRWEEIKGTFEGWVGSLDVNGKPNRPNVEVYNQYLRAHLMCGAQASEMLSVVEQMEGYLVQPNTASYNLVLKGVSPRDWKAGVALLERMLQSGNQSQPNDESFSLVIGMLFQQNETEAALKYVDVALKSGYTLSSRIFNDCVRSCITHHRLDTLVSILEKCKAMDQNKDLCPDWNMCNTLAEVAIREDNSNLTFITLGFMARWIKQGETVRPANFLSVNEGLVVKALSLVARTYDSRLLDASWAILKRSLREKKAPNPETYLAKINALASLGNLPSAFSTLSELEKNHANPSNASEEDLLSPFTSLHPLVMACSQKGYETLDLVYFQLENLSKANPPYKSVAALNCVILGCANTWDLDRAYQTFEAIRSSFELTPNIHSYNALIYAFGKLKKTQEAAGVFEHLSSLCLKPNAMSYTLLVDTYLVNRDLKAALSVLESMIKAGFEPSRTALLKVRRRCQREMDNESNQHVESIAKNLKINLGNENRRNLLFRLDYSTQFAS